MKEIVEIETLNYRVGKVFYSFDYTIWRNGEVVEKGEFSSSHSRSPQSIRKWLKKGWATELVLEHKF